MDIACCAGRIDGDAGGVGPGLISSEGSRVTRPLSRFISMLRTSTDAGAPPPSAHWEEPGAINARATARPVPAHKPDAAGRRQPDRRTGCDAGERADDSEVNPASSAGSVTFGANGASAGKSCSMLPDALMRMVLPLFARYARHLLL